MKTNPNDLLNEAKSVGRSEHKNAYEVYSCGLTKREYFAAMAMQGLLSAIYSNKEMFNEFLLEDDGSRRHLTGCEAVQRCAVSYADALIEELNKEC